MLRCHCEEGVVHSKNLFQGVTTTEITITTAGTTGITGAIAECTLTTRDPFFQSAIFRLESSSKGRPLLINLGKCGMTKCVGSLRGVGTIVTITSVEDTTTTGAPTTIEAVGG